MSVPRTSVTGRGGPRSQRELADAHAKTVQSLGTCPLLDGRLLEVVLVNGVPKQVAHGLGRRITAALPCLPDDFATIRQSALGAQTITLEANADITVKLWVF